MPARSPFDPVAADYDAGRPGYPDGLYTALEDTTGPLSGALVLDAGAGTGIATRQLTARRAGPIPRDSGEEMLRRPRARSRERSGLLADGTSTPSRSGFFARAFSPER